MVHVRTWLRAVLFTPGFQSMGIFPTTRCEFSLHLSKHIIAAVTQERLNYAPQIVSRLTLFQRRRAMVPRRRFLILLWTSMRRKTTALLSLWRNFAKSYRGVVARLSYSVRLLRRMCCTKSTFNSILRISLHVKFFVSCITRLVQLFAGDCFTTLIQTSSG